MLVAEPTVEETIEILSGLRDRYEAFHRVRITEEAIIAAAELSDRYVRDRFLPDKAIDLIDQAGRVRLRSKAKPEDTRRPRRSSAHGPRGRPGDLGRGLPAGRRAEGRSTTPRRTERHKEARARAPEVTMKDIAEIVSRRTGIPVSS